MKFKESQNPMTSATHHGLVKLIVLHALRQRGRTWENLVGVGFHPVYIIPKRTKEKFI